MTVWYPTETNKSQHLIIHDKGHARHVVLPDVWSPSMN